MKSEGNSPTGSEDYKLGEAGCAKKRWLQQAISEQGKHIIQICVYLRANHITYQLVA